MEKLYASKTFLKMADGRMHTPHPTPLHPPLALSCRNHQKSLAYFSYLIGTINLNVLLLKGRVKSSPPKYAPVHTPNAFV